MTAKLMLSRKKTITPIFTCYRPLLHNIQQRQDIITVSTNWEYYEIKPLSFDKGNALQCCYTHAVHDHAHLPPATHICVVILPVHTGFDQSKPRLQNHTMLNCQWTQPKPNEKEQTLNASLTFAISGSFFFYRITHMSCYNISPRIEASSQNT
jgi:hypothetical protein